MKTIDEYLKETVKPMDFETMLSKGRKFRMKLDEAHDDADDSVEDDFAGDDFGGDDFAGDDMSSTDYTDTNSSDTEDEETDEKPEDTHEDDPDFLGIVTNPTDSPVLSTPAAEVIYDSDGVYRSIKSVIESFPKEKLAEIDSVKKCLELIFSGKKLNPEDLDFDNIQNAMFLFSKILEPVDDNTKNYAKLKLKAPLQLARDQDKLNLATKIKDLERKRDTILDFDKL